VSFYFVYILFQSFPASLILTFNSLCEQKNFEEIRPLNTATDLLFEKVGLSNLNHIKFGAVAKVLGSHH